MKRPQIEVDVVELDRLLDRGTTAPLSVADADKIKTTLHALLDMLAAKRSSEKTRKVFPEAGVQEAAETQTAEGGKRAPAKREGHGRTPASAYKGAEKVPVPHAELQHGCACPLCPKGKVYAQRQPKTLVRIVGQAPLAATLYELEQLRCNGCGQVFTAPQPEGVGPEKFDETAAAMIAQLKYGSGMPWTRLAALEKAMGVPLPAATQWEVVEDAAESIKAAHEELIRQAAQGEVLHNDDTSVRILNLKRPEDDDRTGVFTTGIVSVGLWKIVLFFSGRQHAGENIADVLRHRVPGTPPPIQMSDALSRNAPKGLGIELLTANCLTHGRRKFVDVAGQFPAEVRYVLETLGQVYANDAAARERGMTAQLAERLTEPNSGAGQGDPF